MRALFRSVVYLGLLATACGEGGQTPTRPAQIPAPPPAPPAPFAFEPQFTQITVGEVVKRRVNADDPVCEQWRCQHFRLTAQSDGTFEVVLTYSLGAARAANLDIAVYDSAGTDWWDPAPVPGLNLVRVIAPVKAGATYQITVWEYDSPGVEFELRSSLQPG